MVRNRISNVVNPTSTRCNKEPHIRCCRALPIDAALCPGLGAVVIAAFSCIGPRNRAMDVNGRVK
jgi:hypothetical protein